MTLDILISGRNGFIGRALWPLLQQAGLSLMSLDDWRALPTAQRPRARTFLHLANIHANPMANLALLQHTLALVAPAIDHWVQFQSGITLVGFGTPRASAFNFGITPTWLDGYASGKLLQEQLLLKARLPGLTFCYLPLVLGKGGPWHAVQQQALRYGYSLPAGMHAKAAPQLLGLAELAQQLLPLLQHPKAGCHRYLLANPTQPASWAAWFGPQRLAPPALSFLQRGRRLLGEGRDRTLALAAVLGLLQPLARLLYGAMPQGLPARRSTPAATPHAVPWHPHGITAHHLRQAPCVTPQNNPGAMLG